MTPSKPPLDLPIRELIAAYGADADKPRAAMAGMTKEQLLARPIAGKWSTQEVIVHLTDAEIAFADRIKRILAMDQPQLLSWPENDFIAKLHYQEQSAEDACKLIEGLRKNLKRVLDLTSDEDLKRFGIHNERGKQDIRDVLSYAVWHLNHHLAFVAEKRKALGI